MEVGKLNLHGDDRRNLAALLKAGVPSTKFREDIQNKCLPTERLGLLTKKDLHNGIRNRLTHLQPKVFMSDDAAFWNAWQRVFRDVKYNLLSSWHVSRSWNRNLSSKVKDPELRKEMKNKFTTLVSEIDESTFERIYDDFVQNYTKNEESKNFVEHFVKNYGGRKEKWAYCHRIGCGINVNMKLERWHRLLKYEEGNGKTIKRLELVYEQIRRRTQFINTAASVASTEEMKCLDQCLEDLMKHMGYSEFGSSLRSIENFPANRYIIKQRQKKNSRPLNKQKLANVM
ncbi:uncharacterized protein TNCV_4128151 [Trichonephila clavipes]|uniref:Uncharacterized protein n=1 Tax=Trichonephila clavipes TaxID=2585209 RepID=A0A8X6T5Z7_TRICX|nr:uncharacterized protein TNCV_4128151 [Trichonephila clavipes]